MTTQPKALSTRHVLVVDDDAEIVDTIATTLRSRGMEVSTASDGNQGIAFAETKTPDLVILDLMMPRRSGFLVLERLRQNSETQMPIIMITGNEGMRHRKYAELLGVNDYIQKPFTMDRLLQAVSKILAPEKE
jgi:DNA-binding response OmpR family regulator